MQHICIENDDSIIVKFIPTNNFEKDFDIVDTLKTAEFKKNSNGYIYTNNNPVAVDKQISWVKDYFNNEFGSDNIELCDKIQERLKEINNKHNLYKNALKLGELIKNKTTNTPNISKSFQRSLMEYQKKSVEHMMELGNAANFSVPGSGKTTITYAAISRWLEDGLIQKIFVIGPTASFLPWEEEYKICFGKNPKSCRISGAIADQFHETNVSSNYDLFLMHFNTAKDRHDELRQFMTKWKTVLIIDESHYIKSPQLKKWASAALAIAPYAKRRIILSGTPMPNNARDLWTQITFLWPSDYPLSSRNNYDNYVKNTNDLGNYHAILNKLFCRINKNDLNLPPQKFERIDVDLRPIQQEIYDAIANKTLSSANYDSNIEDQAKLQRLRLGRMVRLLQTASNPSLLDEKSHQSLQSHVFRHSFGFDPSTCELEKLDSTIIDKIKNYSQYEIPAKMNTVINKSKELVDHGNKVIIWNSFIHNMNIFQDALKDFTPIMINGQTPKNDEPDNRDELINEFKNNRDCKILIASPASLGESISLHKNLMNENICNHAIYFDRNFNGAQYMQSMDRIHRVGMDESVIATYHIVIAKNTIDEVVHERLNQKWEFMLDALNDDMLQKLDIDPTPKLVNHDEATQDYNDTIAFLRKRYKLDDTESF